MEVTDVEVDKKETVDDILMAYNSATEVQVTEKTITDSLDTIPGFLQRCGVIFYYTKRIGSVMFTVSSLSSPPA